LRVLTTKALQRRPEDRWQSAAQFRDALDEWLRCTTRASARQLAALLGQVINAPTAHLHGSEHGLGHGPGSGVVDAEDDDGALPGPLTRMSQVQAEAEAARARAEFISGEAIPSGVTGDIGSSGILQVTHDDDVVAPEDVEIPSGPREVGDIAQHPVLRVVYL